MAFNFIMARLFVREFGGILADPFLKRFPQLTPFPWSTEIEITTRCHLRCVMCEHTYFPSEERNWDLSFEDFKKVIDQFPRLFWCNPTGEGSAFLNKDYMRMLEYLAKRGVCIDLVDSFDRLDKETIRKLVDLPVHRLWLSLDGVNKETYEQIKVGADFDRVIENIKYFVSYRNKKKANIPELCVRFVIMKQNLSQMPDFVDFVCSLDPAVYALEFTRLMEFPEVMDKITDVPEEIIEETKKRGKKYGVLLHINANVPHHERTLPSISECVYWSDPYIMKDGYVISCCASLMSNKRSRLRDFAFGNIHEKSLKKIWESPEYKKFRCQVVASYGPIPSQCVGCRFYNTKRPLKAPIK
ncbi:MAG: radical SAM protein [bacterium]|nr:radical SAM protein [bacterium]